MKNYTIKIEVYSNSKDRVRVLINKYKLDLIITGFRVTGVEDTGNYVIDGKFLKNIIRAELYISGNDRKDVIRSIVPLTTDETVLSWELVCDDENE